MYRIILLVAGALLWHSPYLSAQDTIRKQKDTLYTYTIDGVVINSAGAPLPGVAVKWKDDCQVFTNENGQFSLPVLVKPGQQQQFSLSADGYNTTSRSYHAAMRHTRYSVVLTQPCHCDSTGNCFVLPAYAFSEPNVPLSDTDKSFLQLTKDKLAENPECSVLFTGFGEHKNERNSMERKLGKIRFYLEELGISEGRIKTAVTRDEQSNGYIVVSIQKNE